MNSKKSNRLHPRCANVPFAWCRNTGASPPPLNCARTKRDQELAPEVQRVGMPTGRAMV
jgi:hypothetical protein